MNLLREEENYAALLTLRPEINRVCDGNNLTEVLSSIFLFCYWSYWYNQNPLPALRKQYPDFIWKFIKDNGTSDWSEVTSEDPDYLFDNFWSENGMDGCVIAKHKTKTFSGGGCIAITDKRCANVGDWKDLGYTELVGDLLPSTTFKICT